MEPEMRDIAQWFRQRDQQAPPAPPAKKRKRMRNISVSEAVRRLHNAESNTHRYDPQTSVSSPHNQDVTTYLLNEVAMAFPAQDPYVLKASCKTYYETIQKTYRMNQEDNLQKKEEDMIAARRRQRRRRRDRSHTRDYYRSAAGRKCSPTAQ
ncbi:hypothetical protein AAFF_G00353840 [Aldrovandia affinis]|uniref:Uncharacterized protein n=1 Tax=Aldrovandia affinis TaxID=143900 RepID=A0AAD7WN85_9TELE|nr:hypothetical protein AAFF_G00353840 [Aldrovandia affinis]